MLGSIEHVAMITQTILTLFYGTYNYLIVCLLVWILYLASHPTFSWLFYKRITLIDAKYRQWLEGESNGHKNKTGSMVMIIFGTVLNWRYYKLLYSHFWGYKLKASSFSNPEEFKKLNKYFLLANIVLVYVPLIAIDIYGLIDLDWGTQLYICMIETLILSLCGIGLGIYELLKMSGFIAADMNKKDTIGKALEVMSGFEDPNAYDSMTKDNLLKKCHPLSHEFLERKFEELLEEFGSRHCKSDIVKGS